MRSSKFDNRGISFNYYQTGEGQTDLFVQHGLYDDGLCWGNLPRDLGNNFRVTLMDARGFGLSSQPENGYDMDTMTDDMAALINHLGLGKLIVIGHSMGASLGCHLAALYPDLLGGAVLIDPAFREPAGLDSKEDLLAKRAAELLAQQAMTRDQMISAIRAKHPYWPEEFVLPAADSKYRMSLKALAILNTIDTTWKDDLKKAHCPMLLLSADTKLGAIVSKETAAYACAANPLVQSLYIGGAGHSIHREKYAKVLEAIRSFLAGIR
jgi:pimeloyl-ACP methyl ester carboxylesterase